MSPSPPAPPSDSSASADSARPPVVVRWLGTAGFAIEHEGHVLLVDPYVTRASLGACLTRRLASDPAAVARYAPRADAIVVGHTHFDHVLDVPSIALATGARVYGSRSAVTLCRLSGVPETRLHDVESGAHAGAGTGPVEAEVGPFRLRFVPSVHSRLLLGRVPFPGEIADCDHVPLRAWGYRCGAVFGVEIRVAGRTLYHLGSADLLDAEAASRGRDAIDLLLLCVAGWTSTPRYPDRVLRAFSPAAIVLSHWDNFLAPMEAGARALPALGMPRLVDALGRAGRDVRLHQLDLLGALRL